MYIQITDIMINELIKFLKVVKFKSFRFIMKMLLELEETV